MATTAESPVQPAHEYSPSISDFDEEEHRESSLFLQNGGGNYAGSDAGNGSASQNISKPPSFADFAVQSGALPDWKQLSAPISPNIMMPLEPASASSSGASCSAELQSRSSSFVGASDYDSRSPKQSYGSSQQQKRPTTANDLTLSQSRALRDSYPGHQTLSPSSSPKSSAAARRTGKPTSIDVASSSPAGASSNSSRRSPVGSPLLQRKSSAYSSTSTAAESTKSDACSSYSPMSPQRRAEIHQRYTKLSSSPKHLQPGSLNPRASSDVSRPTKMIPVRSACGSFQSYYAHLQSLGRSMTDDARKALHRHIAMDAKWDSSVVVPRFFHCALMCTTGIRENISSCGLVYDSTFQMTATEKARELSARSPTAEEKRPRLNRSDTMALMQYNNVPQFLTIVSDASSLTARNIEKSGVLSLTVCSAAHLLVYKLCLDYPGSKIDKAAVIRELGYHTFMGAAVRVPVLEGGVQSMECEVVQSVPPANGDKTIMFLVRVVAFTPASSRVEPLFCGRGLFFSDRMGTKVPFMSKGFMRFVHDILAQHRVDGVFLSDEKPIAVVEPQKLQDVGSSERRVKFSDDEGTGEGMRRTASLRKDKTSEEHKSYSDAKHLGEQRGQRERHENMRQVFQDSIRRQSLANNSLARALSSQSLLTLPAFHDTASSDRGSTMTSETDGGYVIVDDVDGTMAKLAIRNGDGDEHYLHPSEICQSASVIDRLRHRKTVSINKEFLSVDLEWSHCSPKPDGHSGVVSSVNFNPEDQIFLASAGTDETVKLWNISKHDGVLLRTMTGHRGAIRQCQFHPTGMYLASTSDDGAIGIWSMQGRNEMMKSWMELADEPQRCLSFNVDGTHLATAGYKRAHIWDAERGQVITSFDAHALQVYGIHFHPTFNVAVTCGDDHAVKVWDLDSGKCVHRFEGHRSWVHSARFSEDGMLLGSASNDTTVQVRDWRVNTTLFSLTQHRAPVTCVDFGGGFVFSGCRDTCVRVFSASTGDMVLDFAAHSGSIFSMAYASNLGLLATSGSDGFVRLWNMRWKKLKNAI
eukprot:ANDGO_06123.mRNA.1 putative WD repeat-containing protein alr3466